MKIDDRYDRLANYDLYDELPLPIKVKDNTEGIAKRSYEIATALANKLKEESQCEK